MSYNRALVEHLLPAVWDEYAAYGKRNPLEPDQDMPRARPNPKCGNNLPAYLADIRQAWAKAPLSWHEKRALFARYCLDYSGPEAGALLKVPARTVNHRAETGVGRITAWLNGDPYDSNYDIESEAVLREL